MQFTKNTSCLLVALVLLGSASAQQSCSPNNPTTTTCPTGTTCHAMVGNTNGEGTCIADDTSVCWMNLGQFGCKQQEGRNSHDEGCFETQEACNKGAAGKDRTLKSVSTVRKCNPKLPKTFSCGLFTDMICQVIVGNNHGDGQCVPKQHPSPAPTPAAAPSPQSCSSNNPTTTPCPTDTTFHAAATDRVTYFAFH